MTRRFLDSLYSPCTGGVVELRAYPSGARTWTTPGNWAALGSFITSQVRAGQNVALGVATRQDRTSGRTANLRELPALFVDLDRPPDKARERLQILPFRASWVISSGRHVHADHLLKEPPNIADVAEWTRASSILRRLSTHLDGDESATDTARVLRLPGTFNFKHADPLRVTVLEQANTTFNLSEFDDLLPREVAHRGELVLDNRLCEGRRNDSLYGVIRSLRYRGLPDRVIWRVLEVINTEWCDPPLEAAELTRLLRYALVQGDRPDFIARHSTEDVVHDAVDADGVKSCG